MSLLKTLYRGDTNVDFRPLWRRSVVISGSLVVISLLLLLVRGLNLSIDFEGGGVWEVPVADVVRLATPSPPGPAVAAPLSVPSSRSKTIVTSAGSRSASTRS